MKLVSYFGAAQNMGLVDRVLRFILGLALIVVVLMELGNGEALGMYAYLPIIAIYPLMTAILGWDPLYHLGHVRSCQASGRNSCGTLPYEVEAAVGKKVECGDGYDCSLAGSHHAHESHR